MEFSSDDLQRLLTLLKWRRDVRHFRTDPIPEPAIAKLQEAMSLAPSVGNARPWRVIRVEDPAIRQAVRDDFTRCNTDAAKAYSGEQLSQYAKLKLAGLEDAPLQLAIFNRQDPEEGHGLGRQTMPETLLQSTAMAIFSIWLAARAQNLGLGMVSILDPERIKKILQVEDDWHFAAWLCIGIPEFEDDTPLLHRTGWQENDEADWSVL